MARIDIHELTQNATVYGLRAREVQQDPAVQKACSAAARDAATAVKSVAEAGSEIRAAWLRTGTRGAGDLTGLLA